MGLLLFDLCLLEVSFVFVAWVVVFVCLLFVVSCVVLIYCCLACLRVVEFVFVCFCVGDSA